MSDSSLPNNSIRRSLIEGLLPIALAAALTAIYITFPKIATRWEPPGHLLFRGLVALIGLTGVIKCAAILARVRSKIPRWMSLTQNRMSIPLEGWIYLGIIVVVFTGAMLTKQNTLMLVFALMAGPFVINGWMTFGMLQSAGVLRQVSPRAMQGELFSIEIILKNHRPLFALWMMTVQDEINHSDEHLEADVLFSRISPRTEQSGQYQLRLAHRGRYRFGPIRIASRFPLGLVERRRVYSIVDEVLIYPRIGRVSPSWQLRLAGATELVTQSQPHHGVFHDDFHRLREFRPGDNPRAIHWRSTARRGELILREFQQNREHTLAIVLDLHDESRPFKNSTPNVELRELIDFTLSFVGSLLAERGRQCRDGFLTLAASGQEVFRWEGQGNSIGLETLFDGLAVLEPGPANEVTSLLRDTLQHSSLSTQILVVTSRRTELPYQDLLTSRIDVLNVWDVDRTQLLTFEDNPHPKHF